MKITKNIYKSGAIRIIFGTMVLIIIAQGALADDWPMFHHDTTHTGKSAEKVIPPLSLLWNYTLLDMWQKPNSYSSPVVSNGLVYVLHRGYHINGITALDATTGAVKWDYGRIYYYPIKPPTIYNGVVYAGDAHNEFALDAITGDTKWSYNSSWTAATSSSTVSNGVVYFGANNYPDSEIEVLALNATTGSLIWKYILGSIVSSAPAVSNGVVYIGSTDGNIYALDAINGELKWKYTTGGIADSSPAISNGVVYIGSTDGNIYALDAINGELKWEYTTGGIADSSPAISNGVVYTASTACSYQTCSVAGDYEYALDATTGALIWKTSIGDFVDAPAVSENVVYMEGLNGIYALDATTGALIWNKTIGAADYYRPISSPVVSNGIVYFGSKNGIYAFGTDVTNPTINILAPANGQTYLLNQVVTARYSCIDSQSGVVATCQGTFIDGDNIDTSSVGSKTFTVTSQDNAGNVQTVTNTYNVTYSSSGMCNNDSGHQILQPINSDGSSVFKQGSTVPAKFRVCDANGVSIGDPGVVSKFVMKSYTGGAAGIDENVYSTTPDTVYRWASTEEQWIYNMDTKNLAKGYIYTYEITLNDGTVIDFTYGVR